ncbi:hypothetical protein CFELI_10535 [Corynebacterium felinum]|uniref:Uncharacterized protein n=1 Tax=Corynebacterium felinum TaxID=131318 RepID=A0ABU2B809_9CORY|nr:hypothetical protein [Corynebacterium felinum]WJY95705.1 hypothetical protein CFELI_10535 [Corynebacterium felinum]
MVRSCSGVRLAVRSAPNCDAHALKSPLPSTAAVENVDGVCTYEGVLV